MNTFQMFTGTIPRSITTIRTQMRRQDSLKLEKPAKAGISDLLPGVIPTKVSGFADI